MSIIVEDVSKKYGEQKALDEVSFSISTGEVCGFLGPNGAGKSTLMKIITGFIAPDSGKILINNIDIEQDPVNIKRRIGYLPEHNPLYPEMYIREYLGYVGGLYKLGRRTKERVDDLIALTGLSPEKHKKIGQLSKGYRQRVGLAQALMHDPDVLILDEPTSGLDPNQIVEIRKLIVETGREKTIIMSTHIMQEVEAVCNRVIIIDKGRIRADEQKSELYNSLSRNKTIIAEFDKECEQAELAAIEGVSRTRHLSGSSYLLESDGDSDIRPLVFRFAVDKGLTVLSMQQQEQNIEEVFRKLTSQ